jgi:hypothetical protein
MADACYVPNYLPASYKGVPFYALAVNSQHGRRGAEGEFPFGEDTAYADLGRRIRTFSVGGRFDTNDHIERSEALIAAVESPGPGILVHPTRGVIMVACKQLRISDNPDTDQGVTTFDMDMVEASILPNGLQLIGSLLGLSLDPLIDAVTELFGEQFGVDLTTFYDMGAVMFATATAVRSIYTGFQQASSGEVDLNVYRSLAQLSTLAQDNGQMMDKPTMQAAIVNGMALINKYGDSTLKQQLFRSIINTNTYSIVVGSTGEASVNAVQTSMRALGAGYLARAVLETTPKDMNEAFTQYDRVVAVFEQELEIANDLCETKFYVKLARFMNDVKAQLLDRAYNSPALVQYQFGGSVHSLVAAYEIYNDAGMFSDIEQRNPSGFPWQVGPNVIAARSA